jgi:hypothetical protein
MALSAGVRKKPCLERKCRQPMEFNSASAPAPADSATAIDGRSDEQTVTEPAVTAPAMDDEPPVATALEQGGGPTQRLPAEEHESTRFEPVRSAISATFVSLMSTGLREAEE